jgi:mannan endo-1,4-beta-mannosidase
VLCIAAVAVLVAGGTVVVLTVPQHSVATPATNSFVTRSGHQLMLNGSVFRFSGTNIYWGAYDQNADAGNSYPTPFLVQGALQTAQDMGETVVRCQTCGISTGSPLSVEPSLGVFNQTALQHIDYFVAQAQAYGIRLVIPLTDNYDYYLGSYCNFTDWLNLTTTADCPSAAAATDFYTNPQAIAAFEAYIQVLLNHVNSYTGVENKDNPTIMAWETGNELPYGTGGAAEFTQWTATISAYIKSIAPDQLVMDGSNSLDPGDLQLGTVDIQDMHQYPVDTGTLNTEASETQAANQVLVVGEYGWNTSELATYLAYIQSVPAISGDLYWGLQPQGDDFGFVEHYDGYQLQFPGNDYDVGTTGSAGPDLASVSDASQVTLLRNHAYAMSGSPVPAYQVPSAPVITNVEHVESPTAGTGNLLEWQGSPGAGSYLVDSASGSAGPWTSVGQITAAATVLPYLAAGGGLGPDLWYRVTAVNPSGVAGPPSAPFQVQNLTLDDNLYSLADTFSHSSGVTIHTATPALYDGDAFRADFAPGTAAQSVVWKVANTQDIEYIAYYDTEDATQFVPQVSEDNVNYTSLPAADVEQEQLAGVSGDRVETIYTIDNIPTSLLGGEANYVRIERTAGATGLAQLGEVRITYP